MKYKIIISFLFIYIASLTNAYSIPRCEEFYQAVYNDPIREDVNRMYYENKRDLGFRLKKFYNPETKTNELFITEDKNFVVGKITLEKYFDKLKPGDELIKIDDVSIKYIALTDTDKNKLRINISNHFDTDQEVKFTFLRDGEEFSLKFINSETDYNTPILDFFVNSIDINEKDGFFIASIKTDFLEELNYKYDISKIFWDTVIFDKEFVDEKLYDYADERCYFSEELWSKLNTVDPTFGLQFDNIIKEEKQIRDSIFEIEAIHDMYYEDTSAGLYYDQDELGELSDQILDNLSKENYFFYENNIKLVNNSSSVYKIKNDFNLISFPFDSQKLKIHLFDDKHSLDYYRLEFSYWSEIKAEEFRKENNIQGWDITDVRLTYKPHINPLTKTISDGFVMEIDVERKSIYYLFKIILPIILILIICWSSVWIDPKEIESRLTITIVCLLSLIAYNFVIDSELPKLEYLTVMDYIILVSYIYATIPNFLTIISYNLMKNRKKKKLADKLEYIEGRYGLVSYLVIVLGIIIIASNANPEHSSQALTWVSAK
ncbi:hypothetical protein [Candidatus Pelagibacter communis]|uniref:hypothetical protein n=1 Tax=Pelagibacter ubique TaxID=198252 RepID=UPI003EE27B87